MHVHQLWRYPVKSLQGEQVDTVEVRDQGFAGDRQWAIFDLATGFGLTARRMPQLLQASASLLAGGVRITLPDGTEAPDDAALSSWLGRDVQLRRSDDNRARRYENPEDTETEAPDSWQPFIGSDKAFHDGLAVTLLAVPTIGDRDPRRFRPNIVVAAGSEDALVGTTVQLGDARVAVSEGVPRCVMVTRPQPGGIDTDREVLRWIHRDRRGLLAVGGDVTRPGTVRVGDPVTPTA